MNKELAVSQSNIKIIYQFIGRIGAFREIERFRGQLFWRDYPQQQRYDSDADHSWRMAMMVVLIRPELYKSISLEKALMMALIHDLPEIIAGDPSPLGEKGTGEDSHAYNADRHKQKQENEQKAFRELVSELPPELGRELFDVWQEFEEGETYEAKVVRAIDKWEAKASVLEFSKGVMYPAHLDFTLKYRDEYLDCDPAIRELMHALKRDYDEQFREFKKPTE